MLRTWENVLLLDADDAQAMANVGLCRITLNKHASDDILVTAAGAQRPSGSALRARKWWRGVARAAHAGACRQLRFLCHRARVLGPGPRRGMAQFIADHRQLFRTIPKFYWEEINVLQKMPVLTTDDSLDTYYAELDRAIRNAEKNPDGVFLGFERFTNRGKGTPEENAAFLSK